MQSETKEMMAPVTAMATGIAKRLTATRLAAIANVPARQTMP